MSVSPRSGEEKWRNDRVWYPPDSLSSVNPDGSRHAIHPARVRGRFQRLKGAVWTVLIAVYLVLPWVHVGGHPAVLIDIQRRHFYLFGHTFNAQDFWLAFFFVTGAGFALFVLSALYGRVWCGYGCPQTVFLEEPLPVLIVYWTASIGAGGDLRFAKDVYGLDPPVLRALTTPEGVRHPTLAIHP